MSRLPKFTPSENKQTNKIKQIVFQESKKNCPSHAYTHLIREITNINIQPNQQGKGGM